MYFTKKIITKVIETKNFKKNELNNFHMETELKSFFQTKEQTFKK